MPACITTDLIGSKRQTDRAATQARVEEVLAAVNRDEGIPLLVPLSITMGDEWQGLVQRVDDAYRVDLEVRRRLHPLRVRSGIGVGPVTTPVRERTALMDGPCFHRSRAALDQAKRHRGSSTLLRSGLEWLDDYVNAQERLILATVDDWTDTQFATALAFLDEGTETATAERLGVAQPTVHRSLAGAHAKEVLRAMGARNRFLEVVETEWVTG